MGFLHVADGGIEEVGSALEVHDEALEMLEITVSLGMLPDLSLVSSDDAVSGVAGGLYLCLGRMHFIFM